MTNYNFGDVILVSFPFTDHIGYKKRPAVIISSSDYNNSCDDLVIMAITGNVHGDRYASYLVQNWQESGLIKKSVIKPVLATVLKTMVEARLGNLTESDKVGLIENINKIIGIKKN